MRLVLCGAEFLSYLAGQMRCLGLPNGLDKLVILQHLVVGRLTWEHAVFFVVVDVCHLRISLPMDAFKDGDPGV